MHRRPSALCRGILAILVLLPSLLAGCSKGAGPRNDATTAAAGGDTANTNIADVVVDLSPETLEALVAPIAIYPDIVLGHVLTASTNPQEVLDAGNWLLEHNDLSPGALNAEAEKLGLSTSMRALLQFPETVDMMCMKIDWTTQLGAAFTADQAAVLDAVQRMRKQAVDVGNLASGEQLAVKTETTEGKQAIVIEPAKPEVIQVPRYDPIAVYAPAPATIPPPTQTVQSTTVVEEKGHSTESLVVTGLLAFGAGLLVAEAFDDDDDWYHYGPSWGYGGMYYGGHPYYPPPPYMYRPPYGGGYYPAHGYHHGPNYNHSFNNNTIIINEGDNNYWNNDFSGRGEGGRGDRGRGATAGTLESPLTKAKGGNRPELQQLNQQGQERTQRAAAQKQAGRGKDAPGVAQGARPGAATTRDASGAAATRGKATPAVATPKGTYAGASRSGANAKTASTAKKLPARSTTSAAATKSSTDRGYAGRTAEGAAKRPTSGKATAGRAETAERPQAADTRTSAARSAPAATAGSRTSAGTAQTTAASRRASGGGGAFSGSGSGSAERAASQRGRASSSGSSGSPRASSSGGGARGGRSR